ncbi:single-strand binding protein [Cystoisospora suis]|uniref:Single-strand binding protein n=1 Tax=Cystoisospora suis TaxID=483139 RepID=A0A2C6L9S0_9APIC|nr:single-strand binding protein [Cystoisospora suis]
MGGHHHYNHPHRHQVSCLTFHQQNFKLIGAGSILIGVLAFSFMLSLDNAYGVSTVLSSGGSSDFLLQGGRSAVLDQIITPCYSLQNRENLINMGVRGVQDQQCLRAPYNTSPQASSGRCFRDNRGRGHRESRLLFIRSFPFSLSPTRASSISRATREGSCNLLQTKTRQLRHWMSPLSSLHSSRTCLKAIRPQESVVPGSGSSFLDLENVGRIDKELLPASFTFGRRQAKRVPSSTSTQAASSGDMSTVGSRPFSSSLSQTARGGGGLLRNMEMSLNRVTLIGRLGAEPEIRQMTNGEKFAWFSMATSSHWIDKMSGDVQARTEWHRVVVYDESLVDVVDKYLHTGRRVFVEGKLQTRRWTGADGIERFSTSVVVSRYQGDLILLDSPSSMQGGQQQGGQYYGGGGGEGGEHYNSRMTGVDSSSNSPRSRGVSSYRSDGPRGGGHLANSNRRNLDDNNNEEARMLRGGQNDGEDDDDQSIPDYDGDSTEEDEVLDGEEQKPSSPRSSLGDGSDLETEVKERRSPGGADGVYRLFQK